MKKFSILTTALPAIIFIAVSCVSNKENRLVGDWRVVSYTDPFKATMGPTLVSPDEVYTLRFHDTGSFSFTTDCNTVSGEFSLSGKHIKFLNISVTEMACDKEIVERSVKCQLPGVDSFDQPDDSTLCLLGSRGNTLIRLVKVQNTTQNQSTR